MANQVEILSLNIDTNQLVARLSQTRAEIVQLQNAQRQLTQSNLTTSAAFVQNDANLRRLQTSYTQQRSVVTALTTANNSSATATQAVNQLLQTNITTIAEANANTRALIQVRNQLDTTTSNGQAQLAQLNQRIDSNNALVRANTSQLEQQRLGIGDYRTAITGALQDTGLFSGQLSSLGDIGTSLSGVYGLLRNEFQGSISQIRNAGAATQGMSVGQRALAVSTNIGTGALRIFTLALAATGIGLIIPLIALLIGYFKTFTPVVDFVEQAMAGLGAVIKVVQKGVVSFVTGLTDLGNTLKKVGSFLANPIQGFKEMGSAMGEAYSEAAQLKKEMQDLEDAIASQEIATAKNRAEINRLNIQAKDRTKTEGERLAMLQKASKLEEQDFAARKANADESKRIALEQIRQEAELTEAEFKELQKRGFAYKEFVESKTNDVDGLFDALKKSLLEETEIQNEFYSNQEKNINKQNKLIEDAEEAKKKAAEQAQAAADKAREKQAKAVDAAIQKTKEELAQYIAQQGIKKKSFEDELKFEEELSKKRKAILEKEYKNGKVTKTAYETEKLNISNEFLAKQRDLTIAEAQRELDLYKKNLEQKKQDDSFFTEEKLLAKFGENNTLAMMERDFQLKRMESGIINETEYNIAIDSINEQNRVKNDEAQKLRDEAAKEQKAVDLENQRILDEEKFTNDFDLELERERIKYESEKANAVKNNANLELIETKHAQASKKIQDAKEMAKRQAAADTLGNIASLLGEETAAGKASAIAQATINTYNGIANVWGAQSVLPEPFGTAAKVVSTGVVLASGLSAVKKITSTKTPQLADGGIVPTLSSGLINNGSNILPIASGDDTLAYLKQGEVVLNESQQVRMGGAQFFRSHKIPGFAGGGLVGGNSNLGSMDGMKIDMDALAIKIGEQVGKANASLPSPVVQVDSISDAQSDKARIVSAASF